MARLRILKNVVGSNFDYRPNDVITTLSTQAGNDLIAGGFAIPEGPSPSGTIATMLIGAGYQLFYPAPSGYISPSGWVPDAPSSGAFYFKGDYIINIVFPGKKITTFDILKLRPPLV
jgi:hypothetical protein